MHLSILTMHLLFP